MGFANKDSLNGSMEHEVQGRNKQARTVQRRLD